MQTVGAQVIRVGRVLGLAGAVIALTAACATTVTGSAEPASLSIAPTTQSPAPTFGNSGDSESQQAQQTCSQLPHSAVTSAFGVSGVTVTADSGTTLTGGILQIKCVVNAQGGFRANVVVQIYPVGVLTNAFQYQTIMQQKFPGVRPLTVKGAQVAGLFQQTVDGGLVDEAFAASNDTKTNTVDVVLAGVPDSPGIDSKLVAFITALAND